MTPDPTTTIVDWGNYHPSYNSVKQLYADSGYVFMPTVEPFIHYPTADAVFAPFDTTTATDLAAPATLPRSVLGIPQGRPGDVSLVVGHTYLFFYGSDFTHDTTCVVGGLRGLFDYDRATQTLMRTDNNAASSIPKILTLVQMTAEVQAAVSATPTDQGSASNPAKWPPPPVCALSATGR